MVEDKNHDVDRHVGKRVRMHRIMIGVTQDQLGKKLGLTFQQIQKYENGSNRIAASRLYSIARIFEVPVSFSQRVLQAWAAWLFPSASLFNLHQLSPTSPRR